MSKTVIKVPYPNIKVVSELPTVQNRDTRRTESTLTIKRTKTGVVWRHPKTSDRVLLTLPFRLTRMKSLEFEAVFQSYKTAEWLVELYDDTTWRGYVIGKLSRRALDRGKTSETGETIELTLRLSALKVT